MVARQLFAAVLVTVALIVSILSAPSVEGRQEADADPLRLHVRALSMFLETYLPKYAATVSNESYRQAALNRTMELESEFAAVQFDGEWVGVRDVYQVNGRRIADREGRVARLFAGGDRESTRVLVDRIAEESARFNFGDVMRTVNSPAVIVGLLDPSGGRGWRVQFSDGRYESHGHGRIWTMRFEERARPTLIRTPQGGDIPAQGRIWMDAGGLTRVDATVWLRNEQGQETGRTGTVSVDFVDEPGIDLRVPARMSEIYAASTGFVLMRGDARYTNYRSFDVESRERIDRIDEGR